MRNRESDMPLRPANCAVHLTAAAVRHPFACLVLCALVLGGPLTRATDVHNEVGRPFDMDANRLNRRQRQDLLRVVRLNDWTAE